MLKIKVNVDHAGLSQLLVLLKVLISKRLESCNPSRHSNLLIVQLSLTTMVAMVDLWTTHSNTPIKIHLHQILITHIQQKNKLAPIKKTWEKSILLIILILIKQLNSSKHQLLSDQHPSPLKQARLCSNYTTMVSSPMQVVEMTLITVSLLLVMGKKTVWNTSLSKTPGVNIGEIKDF